MSDPKPAIDPHTMKLKFMGWSQMWWLAASRLSIRRGALWKQISTDVEEGGDSSVLLVVQFGHR